MTGSLAQLRSFGNKNWSSCLVGKDTKIILYWRKQCYLSIQNKYIFYFPKMHREQYFNISYHQAYLEKVTSIQNTSQTQYFQLSSPCLKN